MKISRNKGSAFERKIAKDVVTHFGAPFTNKDCYRTPLSGGHPVADPGDLVVSERLLPRFNFCVECKHHRAWNLANLMPMTQEVKGWVKQVCAASVKIARPPLLVMRGNHTEIYAAMRWKNWAPRSSHSPHLVIYPEAGGGPWAVLSWKEFLQRLP